jgi:hypothetical protein
MSAISDRLKDLLKPYKEKGSIVPSEIITLWIRQLKYMGEPNFFRLRVKQVLKRLIGNNPTIRVLRGAVHVLTDEQASAYNPKFFESGRKKLRRATKQMGSVDTTNLPQDQFEGHQKRLAQMALQLHLVGMKAAPGADFFEENRRRA